MAKASETSGSSKGRGGGGMGVQPPRGLSWGTTQTLTRSSWHGGDQGPPPLPPVDPGAENHRDHVENIQAQVTCSRGRASPSGVLAAGPREQGCPSHRWSLLVVLCVCTLPSVSKWSPRPLPPPSLTHHPFLQSWTLTTQQSRP